MAMEQLFRIEKAAEMLDVSLKTLRKWWYERKIQIVKVGGDVRVAASEIERIQKAGKREAIAF
ncbi:MAG: helix-turn-helix domain-containing protein [Nitrospiraceae bacterium]|jgi:excisionase family DNA binding protein|nr:helix-turn-helix domain-containing protein [Nitrospiraceae bacterium]